MPDLPRFLVHFDQNYRIFATKLRFRIRRVVLERVLIIYIYTKLLFECCIPLINLFSFGSPTSYY